MNDATPVLLTDADEELWETFHANSRTTRIDVLPSDAFVSERMARMPRCFRYEGYPIITLPDEWIPLEHKLTDALRNRRSPSLADFQDAERMDIAVLASVLRYSFGESHLAGSRPARPAPSAGALFPIETYVYSRAVEGIAEGLYHYSPADHNLRYLKAADPNGFANLFVQPDVADACVFSVFLAAVFERSAFKYGNRAYRFCLLEAGHMAQNLALLMAAMGIPCLPVGGFFDQEADLLLGADGIGTSVIYSLLCGGLKMTG
jgi:SagB-type dehydrogenase family enzyme